MKKIAIIAPTGMLGSQVYRALMDKHKLVLVYRSAGKLDLLNESVGRVNEHEKFNFDLLSLRGDYLAGFKDMSSSSAVKTMLKGIGDVDAVINCAGIIKPMSLKKSDDTLFINSVVPHILSTYYGEKLIQITTDCVYDGLSGAPYHESSIKNPNDLYGLSKSVGEPLSSSLVLRTSIVGPEISGFYSLIEWLKKQEGGQTKGFTNHFWNGITTFEFGNICDRIISERSKYPLSGLFHIHSDDISKYDMLLLFKEKFKIDVGIEPVRHTPIDRRLSSNYEMNDLLNIPTFKEMLSEL